MVSVKWWWCGWSLHVCLFRNHNADKSQIWNTPGLEEVYRSNHSNGCTIVSETFDWEADLLVLSGVDVANIQVFRSQGNNKIICDNKDYIDQAICSLSKVIIRELKKLKVTYAVASNLLFWRMLLVLLFDRKWIDNTVLCSKSSTVHAVSNSQEIIFGSFVQVVTENIDANIPSSSNPCISHPSYTTRTWFIITQRKQI